MPGFPVGNVLTYGDGSIREDLSDVIFQITPEDTPYSASIGNNKATGILHQFQKRSIATREFNAVPEGFTYNFTAPMQNPTRVTNQCQIFGNEVRVSESEQAVNHAGIMQSFADQMGVTMVRHETAIEHGLLRQTFNSGATNAIRQLRGLLQSIFNNASSAGDGVAYATGHTYTDMGGAELTEQRLNAFTQILWELGAEPRDVLVNGTMKRVISSFTTANTRFIEADEERLVRPITTYLGDFQPLTIHRCRDIFGGSAALLATTATYNITNSKQGHSILLYDRTACNKTWLRPTQSVRTAYIADTLDGVIKSELTHEEGNADMHLWAANMSGSGL